MVPVRKNVEKAASNNQPAVAANRKSHGINNGNTD